MISGCGGISGIGLLGAIGGFVVEVAAKSPIELGSGSGFGGARVFLGIVNNGVGIGEEDGIGMYF